MTYLHRIPAFTIQEGSLACSEVIKAPASLQLLVAAAVLLAEELLYLVPDCYEDAAVHRDLSQVTVVSRNLDTVGWGER